MPLYEYEILDEHGEPLERFELFQSMSAAPLTKHPLTGQPVRRIISAPTLLGRNSDHAVNRTLNDDKRLGELGFTKYVKTDEGRYEKRAGSGPSSLSSD